MQSPLFAGRDGAGCKGTHSYTDDMSVIPIHKSILEKKLMFERGRLIDTIVFSKINK